MCSTSFLVLSKILFCQSVLTVAWRQGRGKTDKVGKFDQKILMNRNTQIYKSAWSVCPFRINVAETVCQKRFVFFGGKNLHRPALM